MALYGGAAADWTGRGTGVDDAGLAAKTAAVAAGVAANADVLGDPLEVLRCLGGRELVAMAGAMAHARALGIPVILDGFICTAAAACLHEAVPGALDHAVAGHASAEHAHGTALGSVGQGADPVAGHAIGRRVRRGAGDPGPARRVGVPFRHVDLRGGGRVGA
jgi:nicotinate-nucleotide--dimethylbenzimidazole phosphoribosyltransferase